MLGNIQGERAFPRLLNAHTLAEGYEQSFVRCRVCYKTYSVSQMGDPRLL